MIKKSCFSVLLGFLALITFQSTIKSAPSAKKAPVAPLENFYLMTYFPGNNSDPKDLLNFCSNYWRTKALSSGIFSEQSLSSFFTNPNLDFRSPSEMRLLNTFNKILTGSSQDLIPSSAIDNLIKKPSILHPLLVDKSGINFPPLKHSLGQVMKWIRESLTEIGKISATNEIRATSPIFNQYILAQATFTTFNDIFTDKYNQRIKLLQQKVRQAGADTEYFKGLAEEISNIFTSNTPGTIAKASQRGSLEEKIRTFNGYLEPSVNGYCECLEQLLAYRLLFIKYLIAFAARLEEYCISVVNFDKDIAASNQAQQQAMAALQQSSTVTFLPVWTRSTYSRDVVKNGADYLQSMVHRYHVAPIVLNNIANSFLCACRSMVLIESCLEFFIAPLRSEADLAASQKKYVQKFEAQVKGKGKIDSFINKLFKDDFANKIGKRFKALVAAYDAGRSQFVSQFQNQLSKLQNFNYLKSQNNNLVPILNRSMSLVDQIISPPTLEQAGQGGDSYSSQQNKDSGPFKGSNYIDQGQSGYGQPFGSTKSQIYNQLSNQPPDSESEEGSSVLDGETEIASQASEDLDEEFDHSEDEETQDNDTESNILSRQPSSLSSRSSMMADVDDRAAFEKIFKENRFTMNEQDEVFRDTTKIGKLQEDGGRWIFVPEALNLLPNDVNTTLSGLPATTGLHWINSNQALTFKD